MGAEIAQAKLTVDDAESAGDLLEALENLVAALEGTEDSSLQSAHEFYAAEFRRQEFDLTRDRRSDRQKYVDKKLEVESAVSEIKRFYALTRLAGLALTVDEVDDARESAEAILELKDKYTRSWNYGNALHHGHTVLGVIAFQEGSIEVAKSHLAASGDGPGSPQLDSFGPSMALAAQLLRAGEKEAVLAYLNRCDDFWRDRGGKLAIWTDDIKNDREPEFGVKLGY